MDLVGPIIEIVKLVGDPIVRYLKCQIKFNSYLKNFKESKEGLCSRKLEIESRLETELQYAAYHVAKAEVQEWLKDADHSKKLHYYVKNFKELKEKLQHKQGDIGSTLRSKLVHGKIEKEEVKHWREKVEEITGPIAKDIEDKIGGCLSHYSNSLAMLLGEKIQEMERIYEEGSQLPENLVIDDPSASTIELPTSKLQGSEDVKAEILACLIGDEVTKLGVWGMGGIGKTTIMMHIHNELLKEGQFKKIIWITVSQNFDIYHMQEQIASSLNKQLPEHQNTIIRASLLSKMLEEHKPYLLILDDVWNSFKLEDVGIPEPLITDSCKLVLTTRSQQVARSMDCNKIKVNTLSQEEALGLFLDKVGAIVLLDHERGIKKALESTLKEIVDECDGLPLAIVTVAGSLKQISEPRLWSAALNQLRDCKRNVAGIDDDNDAFRILKFSYDRLRNPKIQYCFLYCALYPEDYNIPKEQIIEYWIDEGFIEEMETRHAMKDEGHDILRKLEDNSLLEFIEDEDEGDCVRMHDLIRDMALNITRRSPRFLVEAGKALRELPEKVKCIEDVEKVSLMLNRIEEIPLSMASSTCRMLTTLLLAHNKLLTIPESVFKHMPELKILDLSFNSELRTLPTSLFKLVNLTTLLLESTSLKEIPSLSGLGSLKRLNLRATKIKDVPKGLGMLTNLKCLVLGGLKSDNILEIDDIDGLLSNLSKLEEFYVDFSIIELKGEVIARLTRLEALHGWFPTVNDMKIFLKCQPKRLSSYFINVGSNLQLESGVMIDDAIEMLARYKKIIMFREASIVGENALFPSVQVLCIEACHNVRSLNDFPAIKDETITDLRGCYIMNCDGVECVISSWINPIIQTLQKLDLYTLDNLNGLFEAEVIAKSPPPPRTFSSLKEVSIWECNKMKKLFPSWMLVEYLQSLEQIFVSECEEMEEIIGLDPEEEGEGGDIIKLILPKLKELTLEFLPALKSICSKKAVMVCDSLKVILINNCKDLRRIPIYLSLLENAQSSPPPSLKEIIVYSENWWESLEWDHPNAKDVLQPLLYRRY